MRESDQANERKKKTKINILGQGDRNRAAKSTPHTNTARHAKSGRRTKSDVAKNTRAHSTDAQASPTRERQEAPSSFDLSKDENARENQAVSSGSMVFAFQRKEPRAKLEDTRIKEEQGQVFSEPGNPRRQGNPGKPIRHKQNKPEKQEKAEGIKESEDSRSAFAFHFAPPPTPHTPPAPHTPLTPHTPHTPPAPPILPTPPIPPTPHATSPSLHEDHFMNRIGKTITLEKLAILVEEYEEGRISEDDFIQLKTWYLSSLQ